MNFNSTNPKLPPLGQLYRRPSPLGANTQHVPHIHEFLDSLRGELPAGNLVPELLPPPATFMPQEDSDDSAPSWLRLDAPPQRLPLPSISNPLPGIEELGIPATRPHSRMPPDAWFASTHGRILANPEDAVRTVGAAPGSKRQFKEIDLNDPYVPHGTDLSRNIPHPHLPEPVRIAYPFAQHQVAEIEPSPARVSPLSKVDSEREAVMEAFREAKANGSGRNSLCFRTLSGCTDFGSMCKAFEGLGREGRQPLIGIAMSMAKDGHPIAAGILAAMWAGYGYVRNDVPREKVIALLPKDSQGQPMWPAAIGEAYRQSRIKDLSRGTIKHDGFGLELLNNPEPSQ